MIYWYTDKLFKLCSLLLILTSSKFVATRQCLSKLSSVLAAPHFNTSKVFRKKLAYMLKFLYLCSVK